MIIAHEVINQDFCRSVDKKVELLRLNIHFLQRIIIAFFTTLNKNAQFVVIFLLSKNYFS